MSSNIDGLEALLGDLERLERATGQAVDKALEKTATEVIADVKLNTPVLTGALRRSWVHDDVKDNSIELGSSLEYAESVEEGHRTKGNTFVQGRFMLRDAMLRNELEKNIDEELRRVGW